jgi:hypothetical protein
MKNVAAAHITPPSSDPAASTRFGSQFLYRTQHAMAHNELKQLESTLKTLDSRVQSLVPTATVPNRYYPARKPIVLTIANPLPDTPAHYAANQQQGSLVCQLCKPLLDQFGLRPIDQTIVDQRFDKVFAHPRWTFRTTNPRHWQIIFKWLQQVQPTLARHIDQTGDWWAIYTPALRQLLTPKLMPLTEEKSTKT